MKYDELFGIYMGLELSRSMKLQYLPVLSKSELGWVEVRATWIIHLVVIFVFINYANYGLFEGRSGGRHGEINSVHLVTYRISIWRNKSVILCWL